MEKIINYNYTPKKPYQISLISCLSVYLILHLFQVGFRIFPNILIALLPVLIDMIDL